MDQIIKAVYSLISAGYWTRNLRAEHFVRVGKVWKLESIVYSETITEEGFNSQYMFNAMYQPPEAYRQEHFSE